MNSNVASNDAPQRDPLEALMDEFAARCRNGETPAINEFVARLPDRKEEILDLFPTVALMEQLKRKTDSALSNPALPSMMEMPRQIGNYQILREIGRGGMGVVFQAVQEGLERQVALKVMNANAISSDSQMRRFRREVRSAARLHHTNIVPVFAVGEDNGTHFYSMQFIDGMSLEEYVGAVRTNSTDDKKITTATLNVEEATVADQTTTGNSEKNAVDKNADTGPLKENVESGSSRAKTPEPGAPSPHRTDEPNLLQTGPRYWRRVATIGSQVADALNWAHEHGVLHRDIKPQNLLLDRSGNVWVTDFGLAKLINEKEASQTGNIVGTLMYMSPEQLQGDASEASDVYSLGLTLYEMLALKPAFGKDGASTSIADRIKPKEVAPLRSVNPKIPRDLETIVMKAVRHDPADRYASASDMRDDLQNYLDGHAIAARRSTAVERLWKWTRRNPALAATIASLILVLSLYATSAQLGSMKIAGLLSQSQEARKDAEDSLREAKQATKLSQDRLNLATLAFDNILKTYSEQSVRTDDVFGLYQEAILDAPVTIADTNRLKMLVDFYGQFAPQGENDPALNLKIARAKTLLGDIQLRLGRLDEAESAYFDAVGWIEQKSGDAGSDGLVLVRARIYNELGRVTLLQGRVPETVSNHLEARATLMERGAEFLGNPDVRFELARSGNLVSSMLTRSRITRDIGLPTRNGMQTGRSRGARGAGRGPDRGPPRGGPDGRRGNRPGGSRPNGRGPGTANSLARSDIQSAFSGLTDRQKQYFLPIDSEWNTFKNLDERQMWSRVSRLAREARDELERLNAEYPENARYQLDYARSLRYYADFARRAGSGAEGEASASFREAVQLLVDLNQRFDDKPLYAYELADCQVDSGKFEETVIAIEDLNSAIETCRELSSRFPTTYEYSLLQALATRELAFVKLSPESNQGQESEELYHAAIEQMALLVSQLPEQVSLRVQLAQTRQQLAWYLSIRYEDSDERMRERLQILDDAVEVLEDANIDIEADPFRAGIYRSIVGHRDWTRNVLGNR